MIEKQKLIVNKLNIIEGEMSFLPIHLSLPLTINVGGCYSDNFSFLLRIKNESWSQ